MKKDVICCGIDSGGTNVKMYCEICNKVYARVMPSGENFTKAQFLNTIKDFLNCLPENVDALGIAYSGIGSKSHIERTNREYLKNFDISDLNFLDCKKVLINDSNAAALAGTLEYPDAKVLVGVTNGTGIGAGICINGTLFTGGSNGFAGEINSDYLGTADNPIHAGKLTSGLYLSQHLKDIFSNEDKMIIKNAATNFGLLLTHVINLLNPDVIYLSGGTFNYPNYLDCVVETVKEKATDFMTKDLKIVLSTTGSYTGCIGAMRYALQNVDC